MMPVICFMILPGLELSVKEILGAHSNTLSKKSFSKIASKCLFNVNPSHPIQCRPVNALALKLWPGRGDVVHDFNNMNIFACQRNIEMKLADGRNCIGQSRCRKSCAVP